MQDVIGGLAAWEVESWIGPIDEDAPTWLRDAKARHAAAIKEFTKAVSYVVDRSGQIEAANRAHRRAVRDAVMASKEPPVREHAVEVGEAQVAVAAEDAEYARGALAELAVEILNEVRCHLHECNLSTFEHASPDLRYAIGRGPDGMTEADRQRMERQRNEPTGIIDIDDPAMSGFTELGQQEASHASTAA